MAIKAKRKTKVAKSRDEDEDEDADLDEDDDLEEEEDDEDDEPVKKKKKSSVLKKAKRKPVEDDEDDEADEEEDDEDSDDEEDDDDEEEKPSKKSKSSSWFSEEPEDLAKKSSGGKAGDRYQFGEEPVNLMFLKETPFIFQRHYLGQGQGMGYRTCPGASECPLCEVSPRVQQAAAYWVAVYNKKGKPEGAVVIEGGRFGKKFAMQKKKRGNIVGAVFDVTKTGEKVDTDWDFEFIEKRKLTSEEKALISKAPNFMKQFQPKDRATLKKEAKTYEPD